MKSASPQFSSAAYIRALAEWQRRYDAATSIMARFALMAELQGRLRPDRWREPPHPDAHLGAVDA